MTAPSCTCGRCHHCGSVLAVDEHSADPKTMLIAAVEREGSRIVFPDSVTGLVCIDELEAHDGIIDGEVM